jgi:hypothetical protein
METASLCVTAVLLAGSVFFFARAACAMAHRSQKKNLTKKRNPQIVRSGKK